MLSLAGVEGDVQKCIDDGSALTKWRELVVAQGGDPDAKLPEAPERRTFEAPSSGWITRIDARAVGTAAWRLGAGRARKEDPVSASAGVVCLKSLGDGVEEGEPVLELHADDPGRFASAMEALGDAIAVGPEAPVPAPMIIERVGP
jgi:thymidine phosphorylase